MYPGILHECRVITGNCDWDASIKKRANALKHFLHWLMTNIRPGAYCHTHLPRSYRFQEFSALNDVQTVIDAIGTGSANGADYLANILNWIDFANVAMRRQSETVFSCSVEHLFEEHRGPLIFIRVEANTNYHVPVIECGKIMVHS